MRPSIDGCINNSAMSAAYTYCTQANLCNSHPSHPRSYGRFVNCQELFFTIDNNQVVVPLMSNTGKSQEQTGFMKRGMTIRNHMPIVHFALVQRTYSF